MTSLRQYLGPEERHQPVAPYHLAALVYDAYPVGVAVEADAEIRARFAHRLDELRKVLALRRVGVVVREIAVRLAVELGHRAADAAQELRRVEAARAVAAVAGGGEFVRLDDFEDLLYLFAPYRRLVEGELEAVELLRVVAARHHYAAAHRQAVEAPVERGRRYHAYVGHVYARGA